MVHVTDAQVAQYKDDGFLIVPNFLEREHSAAALQGFFDNFAAPYEQWAAEGGNDPDGVRTHGGTSAKPRKAPRPATVFPWDSPALNLCAVHPDLIDACERMIGTPNIRLCEAHCGMKYACADGFRQSGKQDEGQPDGYHQDFGNNTLGPGAPAQEDDYQHIACFYMLDEVTPGMAPIQMLKHSHSDPRSEDFDPFIASERDASKMLVPAGSLCFYSILTYHAASDWDANLAPTGHRAAMWVSYSNAARNRLW
jgi:ectoine hydroxylase-related dioxygenase (phytanoyl-CoA dioxygenase family)